MENPLPDDTSSVTLVPAPVPSRRRVPLLLRSASAVSHDLDGLRLSMPCGVFQPLTPLGLSFPAPCRDVFTSALRPTLPRPGDGFPPGGSWSSLCRVAAEAAPLRRSAAPFARRRPFRLQLPCAPRRCVHPRPARVPTRRWSADLRQPRRRPGCPVRPSVSSHRSGPARTRSPRPRPGIASPVQSRPATACYRCHGSVPSGTGPFRPAALPARRALTPRSVRVCWLPSAASPGPFSSPEGVGTSRSPRLACQPRGLVSTCERASTFERQSRTPDPGRQRVISRGRSRPETTWNNR